MEQAQQLEKMQQQQFTKEAKIIERILVSDDIKDYY